MNDLTEQLEKSVKDLKHRNENLQLALKTYELPEIQKILIDWRTGELDRKFNKLEAENTKLKDLLKRVVNATYFRHEIKIASVIDYRVWYNIANEINQVLGEKK